MTMTAARPSRDQFILHLATEEGITDQGVIAKRVLGAGYEKIGPERVGQILRANSGRDKVIRFLEEHSDDTFSSVEISTWIKLDINKVNYVIDTLQKKGVVTYKRGRADNDHRTLTDIAMTKRARAAISARATAKSEYLARAAQRASKVTDDSELPADTSTITVDNSAVNSNSWTTEPADIPADIQETPGTPAPDVITEPFQGDHAIALMPNGFVMDPLTDIEISIQDYVKYPLIAKLLDRERDLNEAAKLLDRHGFDDLELAVLSKMDEYSPLEREVLAYVQAHAKACKQP